MTTTYQLWCCGRSSWCEYQITTEPEHRPSIRSLFSEEWSTSGQTIEPDVQLIPEPDGPRGAWAISVRAMERTLGYIYAEDEPGWAPVIRRIIASGLIPTTSSQIWAQNYETWDTADTFTAFLRIRLGQPNEAIPVNDPPPVPYTMLPRSSIVQVTKEGLYSDALLRFVPPGGYGVLFVTLHENIPTDGRTKPYVEVHIDDECIGQLTPQMSQRFLPMIRHLQGRGLRTVCWGDIKGSAVAAEVRINSIKAHEADHDVLNGTPVEVPCLVPKMPDPRDYDLKSMASALAPLPSVGATARPIPVEPPDGSVVRFNKAKGRYCYAAVRRGPRWETTATGDWGSINQVMSWKDLAMRVRRFEIVRKWVSVDRRGNWCAREQFAIIRFMINGLYLVAIYIADDGGYSGDWYTSVTAAAERHLPIGDRADWSEIARYGQYIQVASEWEPLEA